MGIKGQSTGSALLETSPHNSKELAATRSLRRVRQVLSRNKHLVNKEAALAPQLLHLRDQLDADVTGPYTEQLDEPEKLQQRAKVEQERAQIYDMYSEYLRTCSKQEFAELNSCL